MSTPTPRSQIRLAAVTGSLTAISDIANQSLSAQSRLEPSGADQIEASNLEGILGQLAASVKRIQGDSDKDFTEVAAGVFKHATSQFIGILSASSDLKVGGHVTGSGDAIFGGDLQVKGNDIKDSAGNVRITMAQAGATLTTQNEQRNPMDSSSVTFTGDQGEIQIYSVSPITMNFQPTSYGRVLTITGELSNYGLFDMSNGQIVSFPYTIAPGASFGLAFSSAGAMFGSGAVVVTSTAQAGGPAKVVIDSDLQISGNEIKDSNDDVVITMSGDGAKLTTLAGDLKVAGNTIKSSTADAIELSSSNVEVKGDLQVTGNDIKASDGSATISMSGRDVEIKGDIQVSGNDIKASDGSVTISMSARDVTVAGDLAVNGGDITTTQTTMNVFNATATTVNMAGAATVVNIGAAAGNVVVAGDLQVSGNDIKASDGTATISMSARDVTIAGDLQVSGNDIKSSAGQTVITLSNDDATFADQVNVTGDFKVATDKFTVASASGDTVIAGDLAVNGGDITTTQTAASLFNANVTSLNIAGEATAVEIGSSNGVVTVAGDLAVDGGDITSVQTTVSIFNTVATTVNMAGEASAVNIGAAGSLVTVAGDLEVGGNNIKSSTGDTAIILNGIDVRISGSASVDQNLSVTGSIGAIGIISGSSDLIIGGNITGSNALIFGDLAINGGDITSSAASFNFVTSSTSVVIGNAAGNVTVAGDLIVSGNDIKDSDSVTRITFDDGIPDYVTFDLTYTINADTQTYNGDQGTIVFPSTWVNETLTLNASDSERSFALPSITSDLSYPFTATTSWDNQTYTGGNTIVVAKGVSGTITFADGNGGNLSNGTITVTASAPTLSASVKIAADLRIMGNDLRDSNNDTVITFSGDGQKRTILSGDLEIDGNKIRASDGSTTITLAGRDVVSAGGVAVSGSAINFVGDGSNLDANVDLKTGGVLTLRGGNLTGSVGAVAVRLSGSTLEFADQHMAGTWTDAGISLADSSAEWQSFKNVFGERSIISAISAGASGFGDGLHLYKVSSAQSGPVTLAGSSLTRPGGTTFTNSYLATPASTRNENIRMYLNGQLLVSKSFDSVDYDYDIAWDGSEVTFRFDFDVDDTISAVIPLSVASTDGYIATIGYDLCGTINGKPASSEVVFKLVMPRSAMFNSGYAYADTPATSQVIMKIQKGVYSAGSITYSDIGTITYAAGVAEGAVAWVNGSQSVSRGDILRVVAPSVVDATFASPVFTLIGLES